jgi:hypothetical protein
LPTDAPFSGPIFVVGPSRSGTTLLRHILNGHDRVWLMGETYYFDDLRPRFGDPSSCLQGSELRECEEFLARLNERYPRLAVRLDAVRRDARRIGGGADAYFEAFCRRKARRRGREIWGEKTPRHVFRIADMLAAYPQARIVCTVRDPRAVVASQRDFWQRALRERNRKRRARLRREYMRSKQQYNLILTTLLWNATVDATYEARRRFGGDVVFIQRYEELVAEPERAARGLAEWIGLDFQDSMLGVNVVRSSSAAIDGRPGISTEPVERWRATLSPEEVAVIQAIAGRTLSELGYERHEVRTSAHRVALILLALPLDVLQALLANRHRLARTPEFMRRRITPLLARRPLAVDGPPKARSKPS